MSFLMLTSDVLSVDFWPRERKLVLSATNIHSSPRFDIAFIFKKLYIKLGVFPMDRPVIAEVLNVETEQVYSRFLQGVLRLNVHEPNDGKDLFLCEEAQTEAEFLYKAYKVRSTSLVIVAAQ